MKTLKPTKMAKAKAQLVLDHPFFASLLLGMPMTEDSSIPTFATDGIQSDSIPNAQKSLIKTSLFSFSPMKSCIAFSNI
jgi:Putative metallopeptidase domain